MDRSPGSPVHAGRSVDRLINFSDAVVAVAVTVLVLPLLDIPGPVLGLFFLLIGVVSVVAPTVANWLPLGIIPLSIWLRPAADSVTAPS